MRTLRSLGLALFLMTLGLAGAMPAQAIVNGEDDGGRHPYVGWATDGVTFCTASAISPTVVLTAAHCFADGTVVSFFFDVDGSGFTEPTGLAGFDGKVSGTVHQFPGFCGDCGNGLPQFAVPDLAVVTLSSPISLPRFAQLPTVGASQLLGRHPSVTYVGYGAQGFTRGGGTPQRVFDLQFVRQTARGQIIVNNSVVSEQFLQLTARRQVRLCFGDSGSPILSGDTVLAVYSFGNGGTCNAPGYAFRIDTPETLAFIRTFL